MPKQSVNGDSIDVHYGDQVVPLEERLTRQDREIAWLKRTVALLGLAFILHAVLPQDVMLGLLTKIFGL